MSDVYIKYHSVYDSHLLQNSIDRGMFEAVDRRGVNDPVLACCPIVSHA